MELWDSRGSCTSSMHCCRSIAVDTYHCQGRRTRPSRTVLSIFWLLAAANSLDGTGEVPTTNSTSSAHPLQTSRESGLSRPFHRRCRLRLQHGQRSQWEDLPDGFVARLQVHPAFCLPLGVRISECNQASTRARPTCTSQQQGKRNTPAGRLVHPSEDLDSRRRKYWYFAAPDSGLAPGHAYGRAAILLWLSRSY